MEEEKKKDDAVPPTNPPPTNTTTVPTQETKMTQESKNTETTTTTAKKPWSNAEHTLLLGLHNTYGDNWNQISKFMPGRTSNEIASRHREVMTQAQRTSREIMTKMMIHPQQPLFAALSSLAGGIRPAGVPSPSVIPAMSAAIKTNGQTRAMNLYELLYQQRAPGVPHPGLTAAPPPLASKLLPPNMKSLSQQQMMMMLQAQQQQFAQRPPLPANLMAAFRNNPLLPYPPPGLLPTFPPMIHPSFRPQQQQQSSLMTSKLARSNATKRSHKDMMATLTKRSNKNSNNAKRKATTTTKKEEWVQCDRCKKWRKLPSRVSAKKLPDVWYCEMTTWGRKKVTCDTPVQSTNKSKSSSSTTTSSSSRNRKKDEENNNDKKKKVQKLEWVQCETCLTWRKLPFTIKASSLPDKWYCTMNYWDKTRASCSAPQEIVQEVSVRGAKSVTSAEFDAHHSVYHTAEMKGKSSNKLSYRSLIPAHYKSNGMQRSGKSRKAGVGLTMYWYLTRSSHFVRKPGHVTADRAVSSLKPSRRVDRARAMARGEDMFKWTPNAASVMLSKPPKLEMLRLPESDDDDDDDEEEEEEEEQEEEEEDMKELDEKQKNKLSSTHIEKRSYKNFLSSCQEFKRYGELVKREDELVEKLLTRLSVQNLPAECVWQHAPWMEYLLRDLIERGLVEEVRDENDCILEYRIAANRYNTEKELPSRHIRVQMPLRVSKPWKEVPKKRKRRKIPRYDSSGSRRTSKRHHNSSNNNNIAGSTSEGEDESSDSSTRKVV